MENKRIFKIFSIAIIILLSACGTVVTIPTQTNPVDPLAPKTDLSGTFQNSWDPSVLYPSEDSQIATAYPAWDRLQLKLEELSPPKEAPEPLEGKASASGLLYAFDISVPLADIEFILVPALIIEKTPMVPPIFSNGDPKNGDIIGKTDVNGTFYLNNITPGYYYLSINYPDHSVIAVESNNTIYSRLFEFLPNESYTLGVIEILS